MPTKKQRTDPESDLDTNGVNAVRHSADATLSADGVIEEVRESIPPKLSTEPGSYAGEAQLPPGLAQDERQK